MTTIKLKNGSGAPLAGDLVQGEPALDLTNKRLYTENSGGTVIEVGTNPTSLTTGSVTSAGYSSANQTPDIQITRSSSGTAIQTGPNITFSDGTTNNTTTLQVTQGRFGVWNYGGGSWLERLSIDASGNVGIGNSSPSSYPVAPNLVVDAGTNGGITVKSGSSNYGGVFFADGTTGSEQYRGFVQYNHNYAGSTDELLFGTSGTEAMRIDSSGNVQIKSGNELQLYRADNGVAVDLYNGGSGVGLVLDDNNGDGFQFKFAGSEKMRIDASGNVGIGTSSPSAALDASYGDYQNSGAIKIGADLGQNTSRTDASRKFGAITAAHFDNDEADLGLITMDSSSASVSALTIGGGSSSFSSASTINFQTSSDGSSAGTNAMTIVASGNLLVGLTSGGKFSVSYGGNDTHFGLGANYDNYITAGASGVNIFRNGTTERMRIDSSGNVLVGQTSSTAPASDDTVGVAISPLGYISTHRTGVSAEFGRNNTDGDIAVFRKDGTSVGSIGTEGGDLTIGTGDSGIQFGDSGNFLRPFNMSTNAPRDAGVDLGVSTTRFKDLYLSGGVYLGGTGSALSLIHI